MTKIAKSGQIAIRTVMNFGNFFLAKGTNQALYALNVAKLYPSRKYSRVQWMISILKADFAILVPFGVNVSSVACDDLTP